MVKEIWIDIINYENIYQISNLGNIKSLDRIVKLKNGFQRKEIGRDMKITKTHKNYMCIGLSKNSINITFELHRLLAIHFIPNPNNYNIVNHIDGNSLNNELDNLEWVLLRENTTHGILNKTVSSKYTNVYKSKSSKNWLACIGMDNKSIHLGSFINEEDANKAVIRFKKENNIINKYSINE